MWIVSMFFRDVLGQVHALNILRALYQETALGDDVFPYIAEGLQVALLGYSAKLWSVGLKCFCLLQWLLFWKRRWNVLKIWWNVDKDIHIKLCALCVTDLQKSIKKIRYSNQLSEVSTDCNSNLCMAYSSD